MAFGRHGSADFKGFAAHVRSLPTTAERKIYIGECGGMPLSELGLRFGPGAVGNALLCQREGKLNRAALVHIKIYLSEFYDHALSEPVPRTPVSDEHYSESSRIDTCFPKLAFMASLGYRTDLERVDNESILFNWTAQSFKALFYITWQQESEFDFRLMLSLAREHYRFMFMHCAVRDHNFREYLLQAAEQNDLVVTHRGIAHRGFFEQTLSGASLSFIGVPYYSDTYISDCVKPEELGDKHLAGLCKEFVMDLIHSHLEVQERVVYKLTQRMPDNLTDLERFFLRYNRAFITASHPDRVLRRILNDLSARSA